MLRMQRVHIARSGVTAEHCVCAMIASLLLHLSKVWYGMVGRCDVGTYLDQNYQGRECYGRETLRI